MDTFSRFEMTTLPPDAPVREADAPLRKIGGDRLFDQNEKDRIGLPHAAQKLAVQKLVDTRFARLDCPWHEWDEWKIGLE